MLYKSYLRHYYVLNFWHKFDLPIWSRYLCDHVCSCVLTVDRVFLFNYGNVALFISKFGCYKMRPTQWSIYRCGILISVGHHVFKYFCLMVYIYNFLGFLSSKHVFIEQRFVVSNQNTFLRYLLINNKCWMFLVFDKLILILVLSVSVNQILYSKVFRAQS